jgi:hypothetical protein
MPINWPHLTFPPINLWSMWKRNEPAVTELEGLDKPSPCIGKCKLNTHTQHCEGYCEGCGRHIGEIVQTGLVNTQA